MSRRGRRVHVALLLAVVLAGCGGRGTAPIKGVLTLDGTPVADATVVFMPDPPDAGRPATGFTSADGTFQLTTFRPADGALPGSYRVLVQKTEPAKDAGAAARSAMERARAKYEEKSIQKAQKPALPPAYAGFDTTPLRCTVPAQRPVALEMHRDGK